MRGKRELKNRSGESALTRGPLPYIWMALAVSAAFFVFSPYVKLYGGSVDSPPATLAYEGDFNVRVCMAALIGILAVAAMILHARRRLTAGRLIVLIILAGVVMRVGYMLYTPFYYRGHDVGIFGGAGHLEYIRRLFEGLGLPDNNNGQFYHPPLEHVLSAAVVRIYSLLIGTQDMDSLFEAAKIVPCFASCAVLIVCLRLFDELGLDKRASAAAIAVVAFHPTFYLLAASINNDMLMIFFFVTAALYTVRWYKKPTYKNILLTAVSIGCSMSAKFSGSLIAVFTACVFLLGLMREWGKRRQGRLFGQFAAFAAVCLPLGLWYPLRNYMLFGQKLGYVLPVPVTSRLYNGDNPIFERFFGFGDLFARLYCNVDADYMVWPYTVKSSLFGEFTFSASHDTMAVVLICANIALIALSLAAALYVLVRPPKNGGFAVFSLFTIWLVQVVLYIYFNMQYPFSCTMDFRYMVPTVITGAAFLGIFFSAVSRSKSAVPKVASRLVIAVITIFSISSVVFYVI